MAVRNICNCHTPPGGSVECEPHQMAVCSVIDGVAHRQCLDAPLKGSDTALANWALSHITGVKRLTRAPIAISDLQLLLEGKFERSENEILTFSLPESVATAVMRLVNESESDRTGLHYEAS